MRSITETTVGGVNIEGEFGQGDSVGELDCITSSERPSTLHAIRDTELARMPMTLFNAISVRHPLVTIQISRIIATRVRQQLQQQKKISIPTSLSRGPIEMGRNNFNLKVSNLSDVIKILLNPFCSLFRLFFKTIAILPITRQVPVSEFAMKLSTALKTIGAPTSYLNQATVMQVLGRHAFTSLGTLKLAGWLAELEQRYRIVLYVADTTVTSQWTQTCIRQV